MRHLFLTLDFPPQHGGVARYYANLLGAFPQGSVTVLAPTSADSETVDHKHRFPVTRVHFFSSRFFWPRWLPLLWHVFRSVRHERPSYIHVGQVLPVGTVALMMKRLFGIPYVVYTHGLDVLLLQPATRKHKIATVILKNAALVIANSEWTKKRVAAFGVPNTNIKILHPGCSLIGASAPHDALERLRRTLHLHGCQVLLTVARLVERKGIDTVIQALPMLLSRFPDLRYVVVGDGPDAERLQSLTAHAGLAEHVKFCGSIPDPQLPAYYQLADVFLLTPRPVADRMDIEGFGIVYLEANAFGKPVIGTSTGGVAEAVHDGVAGILIPPGDPAAVAKAVTDLLEHPEIAERLGKTGRTLVEREASWTQRASTLFAWLQQKGAAREEERR